jgi:uncharacterized protein
MGRGCGDGLTVLCRVPVLWYGDWFDRGLRMDDQIRTELEAAAFRRLLQHLDENKQVQNIDLMNLAGFCRNCLGKWFKAAADERGVDLDGEAAREMIYGMPYAEWKQKYQK